MEFRYSKHTNLWRKTSRCKNIRSRKGSTSKIQPAILLFTRSRENKKVRKHIRHLKNLKLKQEANEINSHAMKREVEELFRCVKSDGSTFKNTKSSNKCDPEALGKHLKKHFSLMTSVEEPVEPEFIKILQQIPIDMIKTDPPSEDEIKKVLKRLKNSKSANDIPAKFFKYAHQSPELIAEMEK